MINISLISLGDKSYSIRYDIVFNKETSGEAVVEILKVDEINRNDKTSYTKLKSIFIKENNNNFSSVRYKNLFNKISRFLCQKFRLNKIMIS